MKVSSILNNKRLPKWTSIPFFQPKLTISEPGDAYEQEADAVVDKVMRMSDSATAPINDKASAQTNLQRKENHSSSKSNGVQTPFNPGNVFKLSGQPLEEEPGNFFEPRFGRDFSQVRIHSDSDSSAFAGFDLHNTETFEKDSQSLQWFRAGIKAAWMF